MYVIFIYIENIYPWNPDFPNRKKNNLTVILRSILKSRYSYSIWSCHNIMHGFRPRRSSKLKMETRFSPYRDQSRSKSEKKQNRITMEELKIHELETKNNDMDNYNFHLTTKRLKIRIKDYSLSAGNTGIQSSSFFSLISIYFSLLQSF